MNVSMLEWRNQCLDWLLKMIIECDDDKDDDDDDADDMTLWLG